jgi:hypothetical protein
MVKIVCRFPKVKHFITVLNGGEEGCKAVGDEA